MVCAELQLRQLLSSKGGSRKLGQNLIVKLNIKVLALYNVINHRQDCLRRATSLPAHSAAAAKHHPQALIHYAKDLSEYENAISGSHAQQPER